MSVCDASSFLRGFAEKFPSSAVREWGGREWNADDDQFGRRSEWSWVLSGSRFSAGVDIQTTQVQLSLVERPEEGDGSDSEVIFSALIQFEDRHILVGGDQAPRGLSDASVEAVVSRFCLCCAETGGED